MKKCFNENVLFLFCLQIFIVFKILVEIYLQFGHLNAQLRQLAPSGIYLANEQKKKSLFV